MRLGTLRRTKIISTLGPATDSAVMIGKLMDAGVNIFRLNMSHAPHDWVRRVYYLPASFWDRKVYISMGALLNSPAISDSFSLFILSVFKSGLVSFHH